MKNKLNNIPPFHWMCYFGIAAAIIVCTLWINRMLGDLPTMERVALIVVAWLIVGVAVAFIYILIKLIFKGRQAKFDKIEESPSVNNEPEDNALLPPSIDTALARRIFARALDQGMMEREGDKYRWVYCDGLKVALAYMLGRIYKRTAKAIFPSTALEGLFGMSGLKKALDQFQTMTKGTPHWKEDIDNLFDDGAFER